MFLLLSLLAVSLVLYLVPLWTLFTFAWRDETFSYIPLVPAVSVYFLYLRRKEIFSNNDGWHLAGGGLIALAMVLYALGARQREILAPHDYLSVMAFSFVVCCVGGLLFFCGTRAWRGAAFPIFFLLFMVPIPPIFLDRIVFVLQKWSAEAVSVFFGLTGVPLYRDGFFFHLPGLTIEVAKECSGIRSSISLFLVSLLAGHLMLDENWRKAVLTLSIVPITIVKNAVRIVALSLVAVYVDPGILGSVAHRRGGIPIFFLALVLLGSVLWLLRRGERKGQEQ
jgi:exosortase